jgi:hypothetical protein
MGAGGQRHALTALLPRRRPSTCFTEGCVGRSASLEGAEFLASHGIRSPNVQSVVSRYRLHYPGPLTKMCLIYCTFSEIVKKQGTIYMKAAVLSLFISW